MGQIGTIKAKAAVGVIEIPVCLLTDFLPTYFMCVREKCPSGAGFIPLCQVADDHALPIRVKTQDGVLAFCDTCLDCVLVTFGGLGGNFAPWNGSWVFEYGDFNPPATERWWAQNPPVAPTGTGFLVQFSARRFQVTISGGVLACTKAWTKSGRCTPLGEYDEYSCTDAACPDSCEQSAGATCLVTSTTCP